MRPRERLMLRGSEGKPQLPLSPPGGTIEFASGGARQAQPSPLPASWAPSDWLSRAPPSQPRPCRGRSVPPLAAPGSSRAAISPPLRRGAPLPFSSPPPSPPGHSQPLSPRSPSCTCASSSSNATSVLPRCGKAALFSFPSRGSLPSAALPCLRRAPQPAGAAFCPYSPLFC